MISISDKKKKINQFVCVTYRSYYYWWVKDWSSDVTSFEYERKARRVQFFAFFLGLGEPEVLLDCWRYFSFQLVCGSWKSACGCWYRCHLTLFVGGFINCQTAVDSHYSNWQVGGCARTNHWVDLVPGWLLWISYCMVSFDLYYENRWSFDHQLPHIAY